MNEFYITKKKGMVCEMICAGVALANGENGTSPHLCQRWRALRLLY